MLVAILVAVTAALLYRGWSFYGLSLEDRVVHPDFRRLRPSGTIGNGYGFVAAALVVTNLAYLVRRHLAHRRLGAMRVWLDVHVFTGLTAAVLATFHSAFQLRTPIAQATAASLAVVVVTGLIGRFLYMLSPGGEHERLRAALDDAGAAIPGLREPARLALDALPGPRLSANASLLRSLAAIPAWRRVTRARRRALAMLAPERRDLGRDARRSMSALYAASNAEARASGTAALLRSWRGLHRFFALLMLVAIGLHAGVAWYYGYRWIFT